MSHIGRFNSQNYYVVTVVMMPFKQTCEPTVYVSLRFILILSCGKCKSFNLPEKVTRADVIFGCGQSHCSGVS